MDAAPASGTRVGESVPGEHGLAAQGLAGPAGDGPQPELRELLFADMPAARAREVFLRAGAAAAPLVVLADAALARDAEAAASALDLVRAEGAESRVRLQAWALAREAGVPVAPGVREAAEVLGVVVDVGLDEGLDTLAGFADGSARYLNHAGAGVVWETTGDAEVANGVATLIAAGRTVAASTGVIDGPRPPAPPAGSAAIWVLTAGGIHLGTGDIAALSEDALGGPVMGAAVHLMRVLIDRGLAGRTPASG